jgi:hypothetical protein
VRTTHGRVERGWSLARGPAHIVGTILLVAGLYFLYEQHTFPPLSNFPNGTAPVQSKVFFGVFGANGWTGMLTAMGGGLLLFASAQHLMAKTISLVVGAALVAAAIIALASGDVLGLASANHLTELAWAVIGLILMLAAALPRYRRTVAADRTVAPADAAPVASTDAVPAARVAADEPASVASSDRPL